MGRRALHEYTLATREFLLNTLKDATRSAFPDHNVTQDPTELEEHSSTTWLLQPLDGETNFLRSLQSYCAVIGIFEGQVLQHSIVYDYFQDEEYYASRDETAMVNQNRLRVSGIEALSDAVIACSMPNQPSSIDNRVLAQLDSILSHSNCNLRVNGSLGMDIAQVARGRLDALIAPWNPSDVVLQSTSILITESGGYIKGVKIPKDTNSLVVIANPKLSLTISDLISTQADTNEQAESPQPAVNSKQTGN